IVLLILGVLYMVIIIRTSKNEPPSMQREFKEEYQPSTPREKSDWKTWSWNATLLFCGIIATIYGAEKLVDGAVSIAQFFGMSDAIIGLTIIAIGTSAPELATTM